MILSRKITYSTYFIGLVFILLLGSFSTTENRLNSKDTPQKKKNKSSKDLKICVISDLNSSYGTTTYAEEVKKVISQIDSIKPDIILCAGDMVAGQKSSLTEENIKDMWTGFKGTVLSPINKLKIPFGFTLGNHDASPSYLIDRQISQKFWIDNQAATGLNFVDSTNYPSYYSYIKDQVFFISWDASGAKISDEMYQWLESQLSTKLAKKAKLRILIGHLPLFAIVDSKNKEGEVNENPEKALSFFKKNAIDLYISGHQHAYYPAIKEGIRFLNTGCIGDGPRKLIGDSNEAIKTYTLIEVPKRNSKNFNYKTFSAKTNKLLEINSLPDSIKGFNGISRLDKQ